MDLYDWLFDESSETLEDSPKAGQSFEVSATDDPIWTTKDGNKIPLSRMETRHICNCIKLLESKHNHKWEDSEKHKCFFLESWYRIFQNELERRRTSQLETSYSL